MEEEWRGERERGEGGGEGMEEYLEELSYSLRVLLEHGSPRLRHCKKKKK